jgi:hypothetical protein
VRNGRRNRLPWRPANRYHNEPANWGAGYWWITLWVRLTESQVFWHTDTYPTQEAANAAKGSRGAVVTSSGRTWLLTNGRRHPEAVRVVVTSAVPSIHESEGLERRSLSIAVKANSPSTLSVVLFFQSASSAGSFNSLSTRLQNNFQFGCPLSRAEPLSPVKAVNNAAYLKEELP